MAREREIPPPGQALRQAMIGMLVVALVAVELLSSRPLNATSALRVLPVADIPARADLSQLRRFVDAYAFMVIEPRRQLNFLSAATMTPPTTAPVAVPDDTPRLGYLIREFSFLGMPIYAQRDPGFALYQKGTGAYRVLPLDRDGLDLLAKHAGSHLETGYVFPVWEHSWGWLFVIGFLGVLGLEMRARARHRDAMGIM